LRRIHSPTKAEEVSQGQPWGFEFRIFTRATLPERNLVPDHTVADPSAPHLRLARQRSCNDIFMDIFSLACHNHGVRNTPANLLAGQASE
jgi:hypothetical protein